MAQPTAYSRTQIALHWIIFALVAFQLLLHEGMEQAWNIKRDGGEVALINPHVIVGLLILALVVWRLWLRLTLGTPAQPENEPALLQIAARLTHGLFYVLLFWLPLSGIAAWFFGAVPASIAHSLAKNLLIGLIFLHIAGALVQQLWLRSNVLSRMGIGLK